MRTRKRLNFDLDNKILLFCNTPRTVKDITAEFDLKPSKINKVMTALVIDKSLVMKKISGQGALRNFYVNATLADTFDFNAPVYSVSSLPAHDPFGLTKGVSNA